MAPGVSQVAFGCLVSGPDDMASDFRAGVHATTLRDSHDKEATVYVPVQQQDALSARCGHRVHAAMCSARHAGRVQSRRAATCAVRRYQACLTRYHATRVNAGRWPASRTCLL